MLALGVGLLGFTLVDEDPRPEDVRIDATSGRSDATTEPTVLGAVVTRGDTLDTAPPAAPATFGIVETESSVRRSTGTTRAPLSTTSSTRGSTPPPTLGTPWSTERDPSEVTTTTTAATSTTVEVTTTAAVTTTVAPDGPSEP